MRIFCGDEEIGPGTFSWGGAFRILGLADRAHRLTAVHEGRSAEITGVVPGQGTVVLRLR